MNPLLRTVRFGPLRIGVTLPADTDGLQRPWCLPQEGEPIDLALRVTRDSFVPTEALEFDQFDATRCRWRTATVAGHWDSDQGTGELFVAHSVDLVDGLRTFGTGLLWMLQALAIQRGGALLHGAALAFAQGAVVVCGPSGAGKSTLASRFGDRALHDDLAFVVPSPSGQPTWQLWRQDAFRIRGGHLPWRTPLAAVVRLGADRTQTRIERAWWPRCIAEVAPHSWYAGGAAAAAMAEQLERLAGAVPVGVLSHCIADPIDHVEAVLAALLLSKPRQGAIHGTAAHLPDPR